MEKNSKIHPALIKLLLIAVAVISGAFTMIPSAFSSTLLFQDDYITNAGWTQVGNTVTVDSSSFPDRVHFEKTNGGGGITDRRVYKQLDEPLPLDSWILEFDYIYTYSSLVANYPVALTETSNHVELQLSSDYVILYHGAGVNNLRLATSAGWQNIGAGINIFPNTMHFVKLERTPENLKLSIFSDAARTSHITGSPVFLNITASDFDNLKFIQHSNSFQSGPARILTGDVDNTKIFTNPITIQVPPVNNTTTDQPPNNESNNEAKIITDKPVYRQVNKYVSLSNKIIISGNFPENMILCQNAECEPGGVIPYFKAYTPDNVFRMQTSLSGFMDLSSKTFEIEWYVPIELGTWTLKLATGTGGTGTKILAECTFLVSQSGAEDIGLCGEQKTPAPIDTPVTNPTVIEEIEVEEPIIPEVVEEPIIPEVVEEPIIPEVVEEPIIPQETIANEDDSSNKIQICHIPPGNPDNPQTIEVPEAAWKAHEMHGDSIGECNLNIVDIESSDIISDLTTIPESNSITTNVDDNKIKTQKELDKELKKELKKELIREEQKKQKEKSMKKTELSSYRDEFYKIKNELKSFKEQGKNNEDLRSKLQSIISDFQKTINILKADFEYDKEYKTEIKTELKEKIKEKNEKMTTTEQHFFNKVSSNLSELSKSKEPTKTAKDLGLVYKNGKTTVTISLSSVNQKVIDDLESIGKVNGVSGKHVQLTIDLKKLKDVESVPGVELITPSFSAIQS